jgi:hypothetical protein
VDYFKVAGELFQMGRQALRNGNGPVLASGAPDADIQIRLSFFQVEWNQEVE